MCSPQERDPTDTQQGQPLGNKRGWGFFPTRFRPKTQVVMGGIPHRLRLGAGGGGISSCSREESEAAGGVLAIEILNSHCGPAHSVHCSGRQV